MHESDNKRSNNDKPEPVLERANIFIYWDMSIITDKTVDFNRPETRLIGRENETALVVNIAGNLPKTETEKIRSMGTWPWASNNI
jgi:hypothetical protein